MLTDRAEDPDVRDVMASETKLFEVRVNGRSGQKAQLRERVTQLNEEISGLQAQEAAKDKEIALVEKELVGVRQLYDQHLVQIIAADHAGARCGAAFRRAGAIHRLPRPGQGQDHRNRIADHPGRQGHGQRGLQGPARDQRQDRRIRRAQGHRRRPVAPHRHPRAAGRHGAAVDGAYRRRRDHRRRRHHDDRAAGRRSLGRGQGQSAGYRQAADRPEDACCGCRPSTSAPRRN